MFVLGREGVTGEVEAGNVPFICVVGEDEGALGEDEDADCEVVAAHLAVGKCCIVVVEKLVWGL